MQVPGLETSGSSGGWVPSPLDIGRAQSPGFAAEGKWATPDQSLHPGQDDLWAFVILDGTRHARGKTKLQASPISSCQHSFGRRSPSDTRCNKT